MRFENLELRRYLFELKDLSLDGLALVNRKRLKRLSKQVFLPKKMGKGQAKKEVLKFEFCTVLFYFFTKL